MMKAAAPTTTRPILRGLLAVGRGIRRGIVATCAAIALVVIYGLSTLGSHIVSAVGITGLTLAATAATSTKADAARRRRRGGRRRRQGRRRRRRRRGNAWEWYWAPYWYWW